MIEKLPQGYERTTITDIGLVILRTSDKESSLWSEVQTWVYEAQQVNKYTGYDEDRTLEDITRDIIKVTAKFLSPGVLRRVALDPNVMCNYFVADIIKEALKVQGRSHD